MVLKATKKKGQITFGYCDNNTGQRVYPVPSSSEMANLLPEQIPPSRGPAKEPKDANLYDGVHLNLTSWPPLAQATTIPHHQHKVSFLVCVETSSKEVVRDGQIPQVTVWNNHNGEHEWAELPLRPVHTPAESFLITQDEHAVRLWFAGELSGLPKHAHAVSFTIKSRVGDHGDWTWVKDATGLNDGVLLYHTENYQKHSDHAIEQFFYDISEDFSVTKERPETASTVLYVLTAPVAAATGTSSGYSHHQLGTPSHMIKWFASVRIWSPWLAPRQGSGSFKLDKDGILLSFLRSDGMHVVCLAVSGLHDVLTTFINDPHGNVVVKARNDRDTTGTATVLIAVADAFEVANAAVFYHARKVVAASSSSELKKEEMPTQEDMKAQWMEEWYDGFTFCTWNALGQDLTANKIYDALDDLAKENINITNLIIDDNWQSLSGEQGVDSQMDRGWLEFEANKKGFPDGLRKTADRIRRDHPNIKHIAVWHAILGYWGGVSPDGLIAKHYKTIEVPKNEGTFTVVAAEDVGRMYDDFYRFLANSGIDSVKTDAQFMLDEIQNATDRRSLITEYQDAWTLAHLRHLSSRAISCMSQSPQMLFHSQLPTNKPRLLVRNSDDFFPEVDASHPWHVFCNAHNSLVSQHLNVLPDWDMFQTSHKWASFHAAARCVSGGPIYFTDYPGHHNIKLIRQITAQTTRNQTIILRPHTIGKAMNPYNEYNSQSILRIGTYVGFADKGTGILGLFNVAQRELREFVKLSDIPGTDHGQYVVHSFASGVISQPMTSGEEHSLVGVKLETTGWDVLSAFPLQTFKHHDKDVQVALFGLLNKMTGSAAVMGRDINVESNGRLRIWASFKALGTVGIYVSSLPEKSIDKDMIVTLYGNAISRDCVSISSMSDQLLEIDLEKAWKDSGETPGWSNEVSIEVFIH